MLISIIINLLPAGNVNKRFNDKFKKLKLIINLICDITILALV